MTLCPSRGVIIRTSSVPIQCCHALQPIELFSNMLLSITDYLLSINTSKLTLEISGLFRSRILCGAVLMAFTSQICLILILLLLKTGLGQLFVASGITKEGLSSHAEVIDLDLMSSTCPPVTSVPFQGQGKLTSYMSIAAS